MTTTLAILTRAQALAEADCATGNDNSAIAAAIREASRGGYQNAVDGLREMADHLSDENTPEVVRMLATALESMKP